MATTPVFVTAPSGLAAMVLKIAAEPTAGTPDPALGNGAGDTLTELTNVLGWYSCDVTEALSGSYIGTVETSGGAVIATMRFDMLDTTAPVFQSGFSTDVNVKTINDAVVIGDGNGTPWGGA